METHYTVICDKCGMVEYRLKAAEEEKKAVRRMLAPKNQKEMKCRNCNKSNLTFVVMSDYNHARLLKKFRNKRVIFTQKTIEELLTVEYKWRNTSSPDDPDRK